MPTGYTACIKDNATFEEFVMRCARGMGACVTMRDMSYDVEIPKEFKPSTHYKEKLKECEDELRKLQNTSIEQADKNALEEFEKMLKYTANIKDIDSGLRLKYESMLQKVEAWVPPSTEHVHFKEFMIEQIVDSMKFDCNDERLPKIQPKSLSGKEWLKMRIDAGLRNITYYTKENQREIRQAKERTLWVQQLRESLELNTKE